MAVADEEIRAYMDAHSEWRADALSEVTRLRAELEKTHARGSETIEHLSGEVTRLRAELEDMKHGASVWADEISEHEDTISRLRTELEEQKRLHECFKKGTDVGGKEMRKRLATAEDTISRVRAVLPAKRDRLSLGLPNDLAYNAGEHDLANAVREILDGEV
jgi:chromosome segregation ATPase